MAKWLTVQEALERFGMSRPTLYRLIDAGQVARAKRAGDPRIRVSDADLKRATTLRAIPPRGPRRKR